MNKTCLYLLIFILLFSSKIYAIDENTQKYGLKLDVGFTGDWSQYEIKQLLMNKKSPVWSPDGKWIAFIGYDYSSVFIVPSKGGEAVLVYKKKDDDSDGKYHSILRELCFTPDSRKIVFTLYVDDINLGGRIVHENQFTYYSNFIPYLYSIDIYSGEFQELVRGGFNPSWSHNGRYMAYIKFDLYTWIIKVPIEHNGSPAIYDTITEEIRYLNDYSIKDISLLNGCFENNIYKCPVISSDNKYVYLSDNSQGIRQIARIPFKGGKKEFLTNFSYPDTKCEALTVSPDSKWICFSDSLQLLLYCVSSGKTYDLISQKEFIEKDSVIPQDNVKSFYSPCWSPDGTKICYSISSNSNNEPETAIYILGFDSEKYSENPPLVEIEIPSKFAILGNYPNPFNPSTTISFSIPSYEKVNLSIYDSIGRKVCEMFSGYLNEGNHSILWDGCDESGIRVSAGIYFSRLIYNNKLCVKKLLLLK